MRWELATDEQLWTILSDDWHIPEQHIEGLVNEGLNRGLFDPLVKHLINKNFSRWSPERRYNFYDLYQLGYIGVVVALKNYKPGKGSFKTFAYMKIKTEFKHHLYKLNSEKRKVYIDQLSLDVQRHEDNEGTFLDSLIDQQQNPEKVVLNKLFFEEALSKLTEHEKSILLLFSQGYSIREIARIKGYAGPAAISKFFHRGLKKINPSYEKKSVKSLGLMTMTKGA